jgi:hypothetical protein
MAFHHVDSDAAPGGDGSEGSPWQTIAPNVNTPNAGDTILVHGNASAPARIYTESKINPTVNGSSGNRITLQPYQNDLVIIQNDAGGDHTMEIDGDYWTIQGFAEIDHNSISVYGIQVKANHVTIQNVDAIHNVQNHTIGISSGYTHTEIRDNEIYDADRSGADQDAHGVAFGINCDYTIIDGNTIHDCSGDAVQIFDGSWTSHADDPANCEITNNVCYRGTISRAEDAFDIKCASGLLIAGNHLSGYTTLTGYGITLHNQAPDGTVIRDNIIHGCRRAMIIEEGATNTEVYRNLFYDFTDYAIYVRGVTNLDLHDNTIVDAASYGLRVFGDGWTGGSLKNNLWVNCGNLTLDAEVTFTATAEHNGRWDTTSDAAFVDAGTDTTGSGDPGFVDAANDDYHLLGSSVCVDAGVDVGDPFSGTTPDLGYDEYEPSQGVICMIM